MFLMVGVQTSGMAPTVEVDLGWSVDSKTIGYWDYLRGLEASTQGIAAAISRASCLKWRLELGGLSPAEDASGSTRHLVALRSFSGEVVVRGLGSLGLRVLLVVVVVVVVVPASPPAAAAASRASRSLFRS